MQKKWTVLPDAPQSFYEEFPELPKTVANLLYHRNIRTQAEIDEFLNPDYAQDIHDPYLFNDMEKAVARIFEAIEKKEKITVYGDYDADGVCGAVILTEVLRVLGHERQTAYLPHRETEGYGINEQAVKTLAEEKTNLIISCDCGISNKPEVELAKELGMDVIITDHHTIPDELPPAYAIIHPKIATEKYPDKNIAGAAVAFKLVQGILKKHAKTNKTLPNGEPHEGFEKWLLDLVAIASVADMVPLQGESRTLTKYGLVVLNKTKRMGLQKLLLETKLQNEDGQNKREFDTFTIGFQIAPRINAAGRLNHANVAYRLLVTEDAEEAAQLAQELNGENNERQNMTERYVRKACKKVEKKQKDAPFLFVLDKDWSAGVIGLVAGRVKEKYYKPTFAMTKNEDGEIVGSGRSVEGFNMIESMQEISEVFTKFGGHPMASGFTLKSKDVLDEFKEKMITKFLEKTAGLDLTPTLNIDAEIDLDDVNWDLYDVLQKFGPFGQHNEKPKYLAQGLTIQELKPMGKDKTHLAIMVRHKTEKIKKTIGWRLCSDSGTNWCNELKKGDKIDMVFEISVNEWNGNRELQLTIVDLKKLTDN